MFVDSQNGRWEFRPTLKKLRDFEGRTGIRLFARIGEALPDDASDLAKVFDGGASVNVKAIAKMFTAVIDSIDTAAALLYACRCWRGDGEAPKIDYDAFCERIAEDEISKAIMEALNVVVNCVAGSTAGRVFTSGRDGGVSPLAETGGAESSPSSE